MDKVHCDSKEQHAPKPGEFVCPRKDCPGDAEWRVGYGLAGGGCGTYTYCLVCEEVIDKVQDNG